MSQPTVQMYAWIIGHLLLGLMMAIEPIKPILGTAHAVITLAVGLYFAVGNRHERVVYVGAYIVSSEVLWRMTQAYTFWEYGKYALSAVLMTAIIRHGMFRGSMLPLLYFALLLPSAIFPLANIPSDSLRMYLSFNLSGPFALMASVWFLSQIRLTTDQIYRTFLSLIAPAVTIATVAAYGLLTASAIRFGRESNALASGGYGPNQVSALLGLSILSAFLYLLLQKRGWNVKVLLFLVIVGLAAQSALTFSRTGLYSAGLSLLVALFYLARDTQARFKLVLFGLSLFLLANYLVFPVLDEYTGGALANRFQNTSLTGRETILQSDLLIWSQNPVFGVGPGMSTFSRGTFYRESASHTEFSRLLAEHGLFGLFALMVLAFMGWQHWRLTRTVQGKALSLAWLSWSVLFMLSTGMRLAAPAFIFALTAIILLPEQSSQPDHLADSDKTDWPTPSGQPTFDKRYWAAR
ncbi:MAG: O-antigen ligase family protein [Acidobacteriota bacterium]|nr:O-antigen ligase family protein [Acidobacteriota bacterium]